MAKQDSNTVAAAVKDYADLQAKDVPASTTRDKMSSADLTAESYLVERVTQGGDLQIRLAHGEALDVPSAKDPDCQDANSPACMTNEDREQYPTGIRYAAHLDKRTVAILIEDPALAKHFRFTPLN